VSGRLELALAGLIIFALAYGLVAVVAFLVRISSKKVIPPRARNISAAALGITCLAVLLNTGISPAGAGLDAPFVAPPEAQLESFPQQLNAAVERLSPEDRASFIGAMSFLAFAAAQDMREKDPAKFEQQSEKDLAAHGLLKMYYFAQQHGSSMTLRKYIEVADEFKNQKPEWWTAYKAAAKQ
jgi:hypothetical protein